MGKSEKRTCHFARKIAYNALFPYFFTPKIWNSRFFFVTLPPQN